MLPNQQRENLLSKYNHLTKPSTNTALTLLYPGMFSLGLLSEKLEPRYEVSQKYLFYQIYVENCKILGVIF